MLNIVEIIKKFKPGSWWTTIHDDKDKLVRIENVSEIYFSDGEVLFSCRVFSQEGVSSQDFLGSDLKPVE